MERQRKKGQRQEGCQDCPQPSPHPLETKSPPPHLPRSVTVASALLQHTHTHARTRMLHSKKLLIKGKHLEGDFDTLSLVRLFTSFSESQTPLRI